MRYRDLPWLPIRLLAEQWSMDEGVLPYRSLWILLWRAFWMGEFESEDGAETSWGFYYATDATELDVLIGFCLDRPNGINRAWLFNLFWQDELIRRIDKKPGFLTFRPENVPQPVPEGGEPQPGNAADYYHMARLMARWVLVHSPDERISPGLAPEKGQYTLEQLVNGAVVLRDAFRSWCQRHGWPPPTFLGNMAADVHPVPIPATEPELYRTGAPGRPTSMHLVKREFQQRVAVADWPTLRAAATELFLWLREKHPTAPALERKSIENQIRRDFNRLKSKRAPPSES
jgi:hypothetical protein